MFATVEGMVVSSTDNEYKGAKQKTIYLLQTPDGKKAVVASVRVPDDGRMIPEVGNEGIFYGLIMSFGNNMLLTVD
jgi:hypothetical protein